MMKHEDVRTRIRNKLGSSSGESISETLVALLISALALVMLAGVIAASSRIVTRSRESMSTYYDNCNEMVRMSAGSGSSTGSGRVAISGDGLASAVNGKVTYFKAKLGNSDVYYYRADKTSN